MPFLFPGLLILTSLALVPIIIHLLNKQRFRHVRWAAMTFLLASVRLDAKRIKYRDLILMALRTLACLFLALMVARPVTRFIVGRKGGNRSLIVIMDTSLSMAANDGSGTLLDAAREEAIAIVRGMESGTDVGLIDGASPATVIIPRSRDRLIIESAIDELTVKDCAFDIVGAIRAAASLAGDAAYHGGVDLAFITDAQAATWETQADEAAKLIRQFGRDAKAYILPVGDGSFANLAVTDLHTDTPWVTRGQPLAVQVAVANGGAEEARKIVVELLIEDRKVSSQVIDELGPGKQETLNFVAQTSRVGFHVISAVINGARGRLPTDDTRRAVVRVSAGVRTLLVDGEPGSRFGEGETDYIDALLNPYAGSGGPGLQDDDEERVGFAVTRVAADDFMPAHVRDAQIIILANVPSIERPLAAALRERVSSGAGLIVFLGDLVVAQNYNQLFEPDPASAAEGAPATTSSACLLPAAVGDLLDTGSAGAPLRLSAEHVGHEWMALFRRSRTRPILRAPIHKGYELKTEGTRASQVVARYGNGAAAIVEKRLGDGRAVLVGTSADPEWNELFRHPLGPILVRRIVGALMPGARVRRTRIVGDLIQLPLMADERAATLKLILPDDRIRDVKPEEINGRMMFSFRERERSGQYRLEIEGPQSRTEMFVLNVPGPEVMLAPIDTTELDTLFPNEEFSLLAGDEAFGVGGAISRAGAGNELWWPLALLCLAVFLTEFVLARLFTPDLASIKDLPKVAQNAIRRAPGPASSLLTGDNRR